MNVFKIIVSVLILSCSYTQAGELVKNTTITRIGNSSSGTTDDFFITVSGGVGPCANVNITFPSANLPSPAYFNRLYSTALTAFSTGSNKVRVFNPTNDSCTGATYIDITK